MDRNWSKYNRELVKRGEILINPSAFGLKPEDKQTKKTGRPPVDPNQLILLLLFIKFALKPPYRQTQGLAKKLFESMGTKVPDFRTLHYRFKTMDIDIRNFPDPEDLPDDFVIVLDSTGIKVTNRGEWLRKKHGKRWLVESFFSVFKRWFGEYVVSRRFENMRKELVFKVGIMNMFMMVGTVL